MIGGSSHVGKTTLARTLAETVGCVVYSADALARHPGRPWAVEGRALVPKHVENYYLHLDVEQQLQDVLEHYRTNVLPQVHGLVDRYTAGTTDEGAVLEGSALWPEFVSDLASRARAAAVWLTASDDTFRRRIYDESNYETSEPLQRALVDRFVLRTLLYNRKMTELVARLRLPCVVVDDMKPGELAALVRRRLR